MVSVWRERRRWWRLCTSVAVQFKIGHSGNKQVWIDAVIHAQRMQRPVAGHHSAMTIHVRLSVSIRVLVVAMSLVVVWRFIVAGFGTFQTDRTIIVAHITVHRNSIHRNSVHWRGASIDRGTVVKCQIGQAVGTRPMLLPDRVGECSLIQVALLLVNADAGSAVVVGGLRVVVLH